MAKNRVTLTLDPDEEAAIREAAADYGLDLSAFLRTAALAEVARCLRVRERFAEVDAVSRAAEESAPDAPPDAVPEDDAAMDAYLDAIDGGFGSRGSTLCENAFFLANNEAAFLTLHQTGLAP